MSAKKIRPLKPVAQARPTASGWPAHWVKVSPEDLGGTLTIIAPRPKRPKPLPTDGARGRDAG